MKNTNKKLEDVIWAMFEYENILSREAELNLQLQKINAQPAEIEQEYQKWKKYIMERVEKLRQINIIGMDIIINGRNC